MEMNPLNELKYKYVVDLKNEVGCPETVMSILNDIEFGVLGISYRKVFELDEYTFLLKINNSWDEIKKILNHNFCIINITEYSCNNHKSLE